MNKTLVKSTVLAAVVVGIGFLSRDWQFSRCIGNEQIQPVTISPWMTARYSPLIDARVIPLFDESTRGFYGFSVYNERKKILARFLKNHSTGRISVVDLTFRDIPGVEYRRSFVRKGNEKEDAPMPHLGYFSSTLDRVMKEIDESNRRR
jgi:hypothetical protein